MRIESGGRSQVREITRTASFAASTLPVAHFGLGEAARVDRLEIRWPGSGTTQIFEPVELDAFYRAVEGEEELRPIEAPRFRLGAGAAPSHRHP